MSGTCLTAVSKCPIKSNLRKEVFIWLVGIKGTSLWRRHTKQECGAAGHTAPKSGSREKTADAQLTSSFLFCVELQTQGNVIPFRVDLPSSVKHL